MVNFKGSHDHGVEKGLKWGKGERRKSNQETTTAVIQARADRSSSQAVAMEKKDQIWMYFCRRANRIP